ncbi:BON domain-containing protein [Streptomyces sp. NPDC002784]
MNHPRTEPSPGPGRAHQLDYRVAHLNDHLAAGPLAELGVRIEIRGGAVLLTGTVPSADCRDEVVRLAREELPDCPVHADLVVADASVPDHAEELQ